MSEENVEIVRASLDHFNRDGYLPERLLDPAVDLTNVRDSPLPGPYRGYEGLRKWSDDLREVLTDAKLEIKEVIDVDAASAVITRLRLRGRARHTDLPVDFPSTNVWWLRDGRIYRSRVFRDHAEALEAARLSE